MKQGNSGNGDGFVIGCYAEALCPFKKQGSMLTRSEAWDSGSVIY